MKNDLKTGDLLKYYSYGKLVNIVIFIRYFDFNSANPVFHFYGKNFYGRYKIDWNYTNFIDQKINNIDLFLYIKM